jgi:hypothetical protein
MIIVGCDYHPSFEQIAYVDTETGEWKEQRLENSRSCIGYFRGGRSNHWPKNRVIRSPRLLYFTLSY